MKQLKRCIISGIAALLSAAPLVLNAEVTVLGWPGGPEEVALRAVSEAYNSKAEVAEEDKVKLIFFSRDGFFDKLQADLAAGTDSFDANLLATYSIGRYAPFLKPVSLSDSAVEVFGDAVLSTMQFEGKQYGVPTDLSLHFLYYRTDLITSLLEDSSQHSKYMDISEKHLGVRLEPKNPDDWTWMDFTANALYFSKSVNPDSPTRYGTVLQLKNLLFNMMVFHSWPRSYGADWMDADGNITVDSDAYREALGLVKILVDAGATPKDSFSYEYAEANAAFGSGQVAAMVQWNAAAADLKDAEKTPATAEATATIAPPAGPEGRFTHVHGLGLGVNASGKNVAGAEAFIRWLSTAEAAKLYALNGGAPGLTADVVAEVASERPDLVPLGELASNYGFVMNGGTSAKALSVYEVQAKEFTGFLSGGQTLDEALAKTTSSMEELLK
ncbi:ABC transporter substrate-binding protein [Chromatiales bacterium (ex Bugula neritina AB1)]|nr:ABC transporter substrate-binding protein [Chromatiales bacterium (ex Bugula neritina AB1)]